MNPQQWKQVKSIVEGAMERCPGERGKYLNVACAGDEQLLRDVEGLLDYENPDSDPLEQPAYVDVLAESTNSMAGQQIGNYRLLEQIGTGGMGTVYLAERADGEFEQRVALKLIKRGMDSDAIVQRFVHERQILATLEHPNIARLFDGGTTAEGLPFFVLEYVDGETILEYADGKDLSLDERLELFRKVCSAVSFAHQNLVVHRDLKPSNILVTKDGTPKLLDFGIAKLLNAESEHAATVTRNFVFTPEYASPEQVRGEKLTTSTDVYSLGVILYELLTGLRPYNTQNSNISEMIRAVSETEPKRPSISAKSASTTGDPRSRIQNSRSLQGDLDNIILKALRKEPERRYASVEQLTEDIRRNQEGLPVTAVKDTWNYRASKFVQRNRVGVAAAAVVLLTLFAGLGATLYQASVARRERERAEQRFNDVRQLANSFMFEINEQIKDSPIKARELLVQRALEYLDRLASETGNDTNLEADLAAAYQKIGDVQLELESGNLGKTAHALESHEKALKLREKLFAANPGVEIGVALADSHLRIGDLYVKKGQINETEKNYRRAIEILEKLPPDDVAVGQKLAFGFARLGRAVLRNGSLTDALRHYERSLAMYNEMLSRAPDDTALLRQTGIVASYIGFVKMELGNPAEGVRYYGDWLRIEEKVAGTGPAKTVSSHLSMAHVWFGVALSDAGRVTEAFDHLAKGVAIQESIYSADKGNLGEQSNLADCYLESGKVRVKHKPKDAIDLLNKAIESFESIFQADQQNLWARRRIANAERFLADALVEEQLLDDAGRYYHRSLESAEASVKVDAANAEWQHDLAMANLRLGEFYLKTKNTTAALGHFKHSLPIFERLAAASPENIKRSRDVARVNTYLRDLN